MPEIWYWPPNSIQETLSFKTELLPSRTTERRVSYHDAVQRFEYGYRATPRITEQMLDLYLPDVTATFLVPEWPTATFNRTTGATAADTVIQVEDEVVYAPGKQVIIGRGDSYEQAQVDSTAAGSITLNAGLASTYGASQDEPFFVAPLIECLIPERIDFSSSVPLRNLSVRFLSVQPIDLAENPYTLYDGLPVVNDGDLMLGGIGGSAGQQTVLYDSAFGAFEVVPDQIYTRRGGTLNFFATNYADRMAQRRFFHFMRGMDGEMWVPSYQDDLQLNVPFLAATFILDVKPVTDAASMVGRPLYFSNGDDFAIVDVLNATDNNPDSQTLELTGAIGFDGPLETARVSLVNKFRFDTDEIAIAYSYAGSGLIAQTSNPLMETN